MGSPESLLISLGGLAMHPPTFTHLIRAFGAVHNAEITVLEEFLKPRPDKESRPSTYVSKWNKDNRPEFKTAMLLVQHVHDRVSPTLKPSGITPFFIKNLLFHSPISALIVMTMNESSLHSKLSPPPPSFPTFWNRSLMNNWKLGKAAWAPHTAQIFLIS